MKPHEILVAGLICGLVVSLTVNILLAWHLMESQELHRNLSQAFDQLRQSYDELKETYSPKPPISKSQAINIALEYGGWNETTLKGMQVTASLEYVMFRKGPTYSEFAFLHQVTAHVSDYSPRETCHNGDCTTFRYVWAVAVLEIEQGPVKAITTQGEYFVDASTGEAIPSENVQVKNQISLQGVSLYTKSVYPNPHLSAMVFVNASVPLSGLHLFVNGTDQGFSTYTSDTTNYAILYKATISNQTMPIIAGKTYLITFAATFRDNSTSAASVYVVAG